MKQNKKVKIINSEVLKWKGQYYAPILLSYARKKKICNFGHIFITILNKNNITNKAIESFYLTFKN